MKILYFAWLKDKVGLTEETVAVPADIATAKSLLAWLADRHEGLKQVLEETAIVRMAINQDYAEEDDPVSNDDEIALFPPVTGG